VLVDKLVLFGMIFVCIQEEELYVDYDVSEQLVNSATNDLKLYDTFPEILHESLQCESMSN